jgi:hypothetical protein
MKKPFQITIISIIIGLLVMSCNLVSNFPGLSKNVPTGTAIPSTFPESIVIEPTIITSDDSSTVSFIESDVLAWIEKYQSSSPDFMLNNPSIKMDDGIAEIAGNVDNEFISGDVLMTFTVDVSVDGSPIIAIDRMEIGGMGFPQSMKDLFSTTINQSISQSIEEELDGRTLQSVSIDDGKMTIQTTN